MALSEEPLSIVEKWKKKSFEMSSESNDTIVSLITKGIDTMAVVVNKKSDINRIQRALVYLECERSVSLQFDNLKNDEVRSLVYGLIESLHFTLTELTKERSQVKEFEEMFTQTDNNPNLFEMPKEEPFDENSIKIEDIWGGEMEIKDDGTPNEDKPNDDADKGDQDMVGNSGDVSSIVDYDVRTQSEMHLLSYMGDDNDFETEEKEDVNGTMNDSNGNEVMGEEYKDSSETVEVEKKKRSSRMMSRLYDESLDNSDGDFEPTMKKSKFESSKLKITKSIEKKDRIAKGSSRRMKCIECEFKTTSAHSFVWHLKCTHSTTLYLAGFALRCDCGVDALSEKHRYKCEISNFTVVRKREGPIKRVEDEKTTPKCLLCDAYPRSPCGYAQHLQKHHNSTLRAHDIWLQCECGVKYRSINPDSNHTKECTHRVFTLHQIADD